MYGKTALIALLGLGLAAAAAPAHAGGKGFTSVPRTQVQIKPGVAPHSAPGRFRAVTEDRTPGTCGPGICICSGTDDCEALFASDRCVPGSQKVTPDHHGHCRRAF